MDVSREGEEDTKLTAAHHGIDLPGTVVRRGRAPSRDQMGDHALEGMAGGHQVASVDLDRVRGRSSILFHDRGLVGHDLGPSDHDRSLGHVAVVKGSVGVLHRSARMIGKDWHGVGGLAMNDSVKRAR